MSLTHVSRGNSPIVRVAIASWIGTSIEWCDFILYGTAAALVLGPLFCSPKLSPLAAQLSAFATFWVGFAARPVGGIVFGHFGDRLGRKKMLILTLLIMGIGTFLVGCLPTSKDIGIIAPVLLVILRFAQGFAVGGEWGGAVLLATEHSPAARRGFYGSWPQFGLPIGLLLSSLIFSVVASSLPTTGFLAFGWRIPFLLSIVLVAVGLFIRLRISEKPDFVRVIETVSIAIMYCLDVIHPNLKCVSLVVGVFFVTNGAGAIYITFMVTYGSKILKVPASTMLNSILWGAVAMGVTILVAGWLSDRFGRLPVYLE